MSADLSPLLAGVEYRRREFTEGLDPKRRSSLGQFFTPAPVAAFIAGMFAPIEKSLVRLLDPGAGIGSLTAAAVEHLLAQEGGPPSAIEVTAYEIDERLRAPLEDTLADCRAVARRAGVAFVARVRSADYIAAAHALSESGRGRRDRRQVLRATGQPRLEDARKRWRSR